MFAYKIQAHISQCSFVILISLVFPKVLFEFLGIIQILSWMSWEHWLLFLLSVMIFNFRYVFIFAQTALQMSHQSSSKFLVSEAPALLLRLILDILLTRVRIIFWWTACLWTGSGKHSSLPLTLAILLAH